MYLSTLPAAFDALLTLPKSRDLSRIATFFPFSLPIFRAENLDSLLSLSDDISLVIDQVTQLLHRLESSLDSVTKEKCHLCSQYMFSILSSHPQTSVNVFSLVSGWNDGKYSLMYSLSTLFIRLLRLNVLL
ncbi:hypothetical protein RCL1_000472 [Eukaryota sp. TZLM3-RCL]